MNHSPVQDYYNAIAARYKRGDATEHTYRGDLQTLLETVLHGITATNEPRRIECGAPDFVVAYKNEEIPIGYIEAKDINKNLTEVDKTDQLKRYKQSLENLLLTDYLYFVWYIKGERVADVRIASIEHGKIKPEPENWSRFEDLLKEFGAHRGQSITSAETLAKMMAAKARMMQHILETALTQDQADELNPDTPLQEQYKAFKDVLLHELKPEEFTDIYAQTIAYGMFAARIHDNTAGDFTRVKAATLIPTSNPFLRRLFQYIAGFDLDTRLSWIVDALANLFQAVDTNAVLKNFGKATQQTDPVIHFYETFLGEYNPALKKSRGVYYTPYPVVNFIVRAVDDILKTEFGLSSGLADTSKVKVKVNTQNVDKRTPTNYKQEEKEFHKVQILDPATGTGTFLAEVIRQIYRNFEGQQGIWSDYVDEHLIPRVNGFEILMASYAMAHLKLEMLLNETGHKPKKEQRLKVYLTNSLEEAHPDTGTLFVQWLSNEANEANRVKRDTPVMVVLGNPPYSVSSSNKGEWIVNLIADYKKDLNEKKINLDDDYIKFIRFGQHFIDKNGEGILAYISNNSFIDGLTHRQMRKHLLECFDKIYILDLHGSAKKNETDIDGGKDENVFDIQQGVSINLFVKNNTKSKGKLGEIKHYELLGEREFKYDHLSTIDLDDISWTDLPNIEPYYFFVPKDYNNNDTYRKGFCVKDIFPLYNSGIQTKRDEFTIHFTEDELKHVLNDLKELDIEEIRTKYDLPDDGRDWKIIWAKEDISKGYKLKNILYRPFDIRKTAYTGRSKGFLAYPRQTTSNPFLYEKNYGLITVRQQSTFDFQHVLITDTLIESGAISLQTKEWGYIMPLYLYPEDISQQKLHESTIRKPNVNTEVAARIGRGIDLIFEPEKTNDKEKFAPIDLLDYIYAVLHSPAYREKYKEFLKIDFPRIPYPTDQNKFWQVVKLGGELRALHLLESDKVNKLITTYPITGTNEVAKSYPKFNDGMVWINETQYFDKVPPVAWEFYIGGYQPAQKWLKDRQGRVLSFEDILHYQKIIVALTETDKLMKAIDTVGVE